MLLVLDLDTTKDEHHQFEQDSAKHRCSHSSIEMVQALSTGEPSACAPLTESMPFLFGRCAEGERRGRDSARGEVERLVKDARARERISTFFSFT